MYLILKETCECNPESFSHSLIAVAINYWIEGTVGKYEVKFDIMNYKLSNFPVFNLKE